MKTQKKLWSALAALCVATGTVAQPAYNYSKLQKEQLGRGVVAIRENPSDVVVRRNAGTMATAFENQLDALYSAEAMDISTDIEVLENIMRGQNLT